jgi:protocatechuate 3,4-dioxygenase beta subunit
LIPSRPARHMPLNFAAPATSSPVLRRHPMPIQILSPRRDFLRRLAWTGALLTTPGLFAEQLARTPRQTEGPFYPDRLPLDTDNDLLVVNDATTPAAGEVTWLGGRLLAADGTPVRNATIEIWQCDHHGVYLHTRSGGDATKRDPYFQGFGRFVTGATGEYVFRTIKPVPYPGRTPHIHLAVKIRGRKELVTQGYIKGHPGNTRDGIWRGIQDQRQRDSVTLDFTPLAGSRAGELAARWDLVLGTTPELT